MGCRAVGSRRNHHPQEKVVLKRIGFSAVLVADDSLQSRETSPADVNLTLPEKSGIAGAAILI
jgi:hypothetical protein